MKITPSTSKALIDTDKLPRASRKQADTAAPSGRPAVDLSSNARQLANLHNDSADIDLQKIDQIRQAIATGQLSVNPEKIADSLLASARELLK